MPPKRRGRREAHDRDPGPPTYPNRRERPEPIRSSGEKAEATEVVRLTSSVDEGVHDAGILPPRRFTILLHGDGRDEVAARNPTVGNAGAEDSRSPSLDHVRHRGSERWADPVGIVRSKPTRVVSGTSAEGDLSWPSRDRRHGIDDQSASLSTHDVPIPLGGCHGRTVGAILPRGGQNRRRKIRQRDTGRNDRNQGEHRIYNAGQTPFVPSPLDSSGAKIGSGKGLPTLE